MMRTWYVVASMVIVLSPAAFGQVGSDTAATSGPNAAGEENPQAGKPWVVLSNLTFQRDGIAGIFEADYELVEGEPEDGAEYVWFVQVGVGTRLKKYAEFPFKLQPARGHLREVVRGLGSAAANAETYVAKKLEKPAGSRLRGPAHEKISGLLKEGEAKSAAKRPPTIVELAGPDAVGKLFAIAKPAIEPGRDNRQSFSVEFQLRGELDAAARYFWVVKPPNSSPMQFDVTLTIRRTKQGTGKFRASPRGSEVDVNQGPFEMSIETPQDGTSLRGPRETISNTVTLK